MSDVSSSSSQPIITTKNSYGNQNKIKLPNPPPEEHAKIKAEILKVCTIPLFFLTLALTILQNLPFKYFIRYFTYIYIILNILNILKYCNKLVYIV